MEIDTGSSLTIMSWTMLKKAVPNLSRHKLKVPDLYLSDYQGNRIPVLGQGTFQVQFKSFNGLLPVTVVGRVLQSLLDLDWFQSLGLGMTGINTIHDESTEELLKEFEDIFSTGPVTPDKPDESVCICVDYKCTINKALQQSAYPVPIKATVAEPLHWLLSKKAKWTWGRAEAAAFAVVKRLLSEDTFLVQYNQTLPLVLTCDTSPFGVGAILSHHVSNGTETPIAYYSRNLSAAEWNYSQMDHEGLAAVAGIKCFHEYLYGCDFEIITDHKPLLGLLAGDQPTPALLSPQMTHWTIFLMAYSYRLIHRPVLEALHVGHPGIVRKKYLARSYVWWPNMDREIEECVATCKSCQESRPAPPEVPAKEWERPQAPWSRVHIDFAGPVHGQVFMVVVDAYLKWLEILLMTSTTAEAVIKALLRLFSTHGLPDILVSDNRPQFTAMQFETFLASQGIRHALVTPFHPASNGQVEKMVRSAKEALSRMGPGDWQTQVDHFLLIQHIMPSATTGTSPSELLMGRWLRSPLDRLHSNYSAATPPDSTGKLRHFSIGDRVYAHNYAGGGL
ncbi:PREDICTED: uncharacterized protein LOC106540965 [Thamnophis sirtalis]|uniref:Gypsy retrotransposon integrase-like protein 1 n=1 Tax=Thamnophis sirtalis TaxID=35019 RepID=A0A6I9XLQ1_9SAUR|nr:PREDICTED: uncharacterized protein LOC106540965 [Thamnophis sirtalis]